ncbi:MAG: J domain-containing protein [Bacteroidetes bacterium]|nr:J domain-containing protein [Bacteroidota bacterium]
MEFKDYYSILELAPSATSTDIKKAYRRLALVHHPDKNPNNPEAAAQFAAIKEAYEVLMDPARKEYYLQQRWYRQSMGSRKSQPIVTPANILKEAIELERYVSKLDIFRMDKAGLQQYILDLLSEDTVEKLQQFHDPEAMRQIQSIVLRAARPLPFAYLTPVAQRLQSLCKDDPEGLDSIRGFMQLQRKTQTRERYTLLIIMIITFVLCLVIYFAGR